MSKSDAVLELERIATDLENDVALCQTREQHLRMAQRLADVRALIARAAA
jgi:hypothetical protein